MPKDETNLKESAPHSTPGFLIEEGVAMTYGMGEKFREALKTALETENHLLDCQQDSLGSHSLDATKKAVLENTFN